MNKIKPSYFLFLIVTLVIIGILYFKGESIFYTLAKANVLLSIFLVILNIPYIALGGFAFDILCRPYHIILRFQDWFGLSFISNLMNQILPYRPGMGFRYVYLHQHYKMKFSQFSFIMMIYFILTLGVGLLLTMSGWFITNLPSVFHKTVYISFFLSLGITLALVLLKIFPFPFHFLKKISTAFTLFSENPKILISSFFYLVLMHINCSIILFYAFKALHSPIPVLHCLFLTGLLSIGMIFPITPGNIGVLETLMGTLTQLMYNNFTIGFSATTLFRASQWVISSTLGVFFSITLVGKVLPPFLPSLKVGNKANID